MEIHDKFKVKEGKYKGKTGTIIGFEDPDCRHFPEVIVKMDEDTPEMRRVDHFEREQIEISEAMNGSK